MSVVYSHDGLYIISGSYENRVVIWSAITGECISVLEGHTNCVRSVDYSYDGKYIVSGSDDNTLLVWDADRTSSKYGKCIYELRGHMGRVKSVSFSIDGRIVSGSDDNTIKIWELRESQNGGKKNTIKKKTNKRIK
jgi:WD40 repeat protein